MNILPGQSDLLVGLMDAAELRHSVISHNLANVNTPGYHRLEVVFDDYLDQSGRSSAEVASSAGPVVREEAGLTARADGNNVDIDREAVQLDKNAMTYQTYAEILAAQMQMMLRAIEG